MEVIPECNLLSHNSSATTALLLPAIFLLTHNHRVTKVRNGGGRSQPSQRLRTGYGLNKGGSFPGGLRDFLNCCHHFKFDLGFVQPSRQCISVSPLAGINFRSVNLASHLYLKQRLRCSQTSS